MATTPHMQRSYPDVLHDIADNLEEIIRSEIRLAKTAAKEEIARRAKPVATLGIGLAFAFYGFGFLLLAAVYGLSMVMAGWLAALVVGVILAVAAIALISSGRKKLTDTHLPSHER